MTKFNNGDVTDALDSFFIDYTIRGESSESIIRNLEQQHSEMNSAVNEWYSKAKAFDEILKSYNESLSEGHMADEVCNIIEKYESGGYDA